jgi:transcriptional regulator with XRE-family HTH domain
LKPKKYETGKPNDLDLSALDAYIGRRLKLRRVMLRMSQDALASMIGVTFQQVQKYESGANRISASRLFVIAKVLQVEVGFFLDGMERDVPQISEMLGEAEAAAGVREDEVQFDPMHDTETLRLVNAYWKLADPAKREKILDFIVSMSGSE